MFRVKLTGLACVVALVTATAAPALEPKFLPPNAEAVITLNLKQIKESELVKKYEDSFKKLREKAEKDAGAGVKEVLDKTGFDVFRDLDSVTVTGDGSLNADSLFVALEGKFNPEKIIDAIKGAANDQGITVKVTKNGQVNLIEISPPGDEKIIYAALVNDSLLVASTMKESVNGTVARVTGNKAGAVGKTMKKLLETTSSKQSLSFVLTTTGAGRIADNVPLPKKEGVDPAGFLDNFEGFTASITAGKGITVNAVGLAKDDDIAKKMAGFGNLAMITLRAFVVQKAQEDPNLQTAVDVAKTFKVTAQGSEVTLRGEISAEAIERLIELAPKVTPKRKKAE